MCISIGAPHPLDKAHLERFRRLVERYEPALISEHFAWSTHETAYFNDLLPLPYSAATLVTVCDHIDEAQESSAEGCARKSVDLFAFRESTMSEIEFIRSVARRTGCGLLLDVNNVFVSAANHGFPAREYLGDFPLSEAGEIHLAGHSEQSDDEDDRLIIDSHNGPVADAVWKLYEIVIARAGPLPTSSNGTAIFRNGPCSRPKQQRPRRSSTDPPLRLLRRAAMRLEPIRLERRKSQDSYTAMFSSALLQPEQER